MQLNKRISPVRWINDTQVKHHIWDQKCAHLVFGIPVYQKPLANVNGVGYNFFKLIFEN